MLVVRNAWFDQAGNTIKRLPAGSKAFNSTEFDDAGRPIGRYLAYYTGTLTEPYSPSGVPTGNDLVLEQSLTTLDAAGNAIEVQSFQRFDSNNTTSVGGPLNGPSGSDPKARVSYAAAWFDGIGRQKAAANYGTNGDTPISRPSTAPASSAAILVSTVVFSASGTVFQTVDPKGTVTQATFDDANRRIELIENYVSGGTDPDQNRTTNWSYNLLSASCRRDLRGVLWDVNR